MMLKWKVFLIGILGLLATGKLMACGLCSGNGYAGAYSTGGYNLYAFTTDVYAIVDTTYYAALPTYGSGCSSILSSCNSCSASSNLYGNGVNPNTQLINQMLINQINQNSMQMCAISGMCNPINPYLPTYGSYPGMPPVMSPIAGIPYTPYYPPAVTPGFPNDPFSPLNPNNPYNPYYTSYPPVIPPTTQLPYGGCDNVVVMCPQGPISPPNSPVNWPQFPNSNYPSWPNYGGNNPVTYPSPNNPTTPGPVTINPIDPGFSYTPNYQEGTHTVPQTPLRYETPRGTRQTR